LYVNDLFLTDAQKLITRCNINMAPEFMMKDIDLMHYFLGLEIWQRLKGDFL